MSDEICSSCVYAQAREEYPTPSYFCRRHPPAVLSEWGRSAWPVVGGNDWCGEYASLAAATEPPVNVTPPYVAQGGLELTCTTGTWAGEPTTYAYQWRRDGINVGSGLATYTIHADDVGKTFTCVVTATNAIGSTASPPSNGVVVAGAGTAR